MRVFLGWSGETSHKVALAMHEWLPSVIQYAKPWVSSEDIAKGVRWSADLAKELETSKFGVICVTKDNWSSPWINFEAGALSREIEIEQAAVSPLFFDVTSSEVEGPLVQFQYVVGEEEDVFKLLKSINKRETAEQRLDEIVLRKAFDRWWPDLKAAFEKIRKEKPTSTAATVKPDPTRLLSELLETTRAMQREIGTIQNRDRLERGAFYESQKAFVDGIAVMIGGLVQKFDGLRNDLIPIRYAQLSEFNNAAENFAGYPPVLSPLGTQYVSPFVTSNTDGNLQPSKANKQAGADQLKHDDASPVVKNALVDRTRADNPLPPRKKT